MTGTTVDKGTVQALSRRYGALDGEISFCCAKAFAALARTLSADQKQALLKLRNLDDTYSCTRAYVYLDAIDLPVIPNTDFLFTAPAAGSKPAASRPTAAVK